MRIYLEGRSTETRFVLILYLAFFTISCTRYVEEEIAKERDRIKTIRQKTEDIGTITAVSGKYLEYKVDCITNIKGKDLSPCEKFDSMEKSCKAKNMKDCEKLAEAVDREMRKVK